MPRAISSVEEATPGWLTAVLRRQGVLPRGEVTTVVPGEACSTFASAVWHLQIAYSEDAPPAAPRGLFLKASHPGLAPGEFDPEGLRKEVVFYRDIAPAMDAPPTALCYDAVHELDTGASHLLLEDLSATHVACPEPLREQYCQGAVAALAGFHAFWWDHPRLGKDVGQFPTQEERESEWADAQRRTREFLAAGAARRRWLEQLPGYAPELNPDEGIWSYLKRVELRNLVCHDLLRLRSELEQAVERLKHKPEVIRSCVKEPGCYTV